MKKKQTKSTRPRNNVPFFSPQKPGNVSKPKCIWNLPSFVPDKFIDSHLWIPPERLESSPKAIQDIINAELRSYGLSSEASILLHEDKLTINIQILKSEINANDNVIRVLKPWIQYVCEMDFVSEMARLNAGMGPSCQCYHFDAVVIKSHKGSDVVLEDAIVPRLYTFFPHMGIF